MVKLSLPWESDRALNFTYRHFANHLVLFEGYLKITISYFYNNALTITLKITVISLFWHLLLD